MQRSRGSSLIIVLVLISLLGLFSQGVWALAQRALSTVTSAEHASRADEDAIAAVLRTFGAGVSEQECHEEERVRGQVREGMRVCVRRTRNTLPLIDYRKIFSQTAQCQGILVAEVPGAFGMLDETCETGSLIGSEGFTAATNLRVAGLSTTRSEIPTIIGALGAMQLDSLTIERPLLLIAGGDIQVGTIQQTTSPLTIVSVEGTVTIEGPVPLIGVTIIEIRMKTRRGDPNSGVTLPEIPTQVVSIGGIREEPPQD